MPGHFSLASGPPPPSPALMQYLAMLLGSSGASQFGAPPPAAGGGVPAQLAAAQAMAQSVMEGQPPPAEHPVPNLNVPKPVVDTSVRDSLLASANVLGGLGGPGEQPAAATGGWTPAATPDTPPSNFMADLFGKDASQNLLQFGLRLMAGSEAGGGTVGPSLLGAIGQAGMGTLASAQKRQSYAAAQDRRRRKEEGRLAQQSARVNLTGGYEEATGIDWTTGRQGQSPEQRKALFAQGYPAQAGAQMASEIFGGDPPGGYRNTGAGLEFIPGGPADPEQARLLAEAKRGPGGADRPAALQIADAYKAARAAAGKKISDLEALKWARTSVNDTRQETWIKVYGVNFRELGDDEESRRIADEITEYIHGSGFGQQTPPPGPETNMPPPGAAQAATPPGATGAPLASVSPIKTGLGPGEQPPYPWRKPSLEGVGLPLPPVHDQQQPAPSVISGLPRPRQDLGSGTPREIDGPSRPIPRTAEGKVARTRLEIGQTYEAADGTRWRWNGQNFTEVR